MNKISSVVLLGLFLTSPSIYALERGDADQCVPFGQWTDVKEAETIPVGKLLKSIGKNSAILLGEDHDSAEHHRWQFNTFVQLQAVQPKLALGLEMLPRKTQPVLDKWVAGELSDKEMLEQVDWNNVWTYDANYYMPMLHFARMNRIPIVALNVERSLVSKVSEQGWDAIPEEERQGVSNPADAPQGYVELLTAIYGQHVPGHGMPGEAKAKPSDVLSSPGFVRFMQGQLVWDRAMAEAIKTTLERDDVELVVGVMGAGHTMKDWAVPHQLADLGVKDVASLMPWDGVLGCDELSANATDYAFGLAQFKTPKAAEEPRPKLGVYLEAAEDGVQVSKVVEQSIAEQLGIKPDDIIIEMLGSPVREISDVIERVRSMPFGAWLPFKVKRLDKEIEFVAKFPPQE